MDHGEHGETKDCDNDLIEQVLNAATRVHQSLGPGLLESVYEAALVYELEKIGIPVNRQVAISAIYDGVDLGVGFRADVVVGEQLLLEIKAVEEIKANTFGPIDHLSQIDEAQERIFVELQYPLNVFPVRPVVQ